MPMLLLPLLALALSPIAGRAENLPADRCQIFVKTVRSTSSSHAARGMELKLKVGWIGGGEHIQRVGFSGRRIVTDLGNPKPYCYKPYPTDTEFKLYELNDSGFGLGYGEYYFQPTIRTGTVYSDCNGYEYEWVGVFFVETDRNTYWLNPSLDTAQLYHLDANGRQLMIDKAGDFHEMPTTREDLRYYNPLGCQ